MALQPGTMHLSAEANRQATRTGRAHVDPCPTLALVIPTLREAANIRLLLDRVRAALGRCEVPYEVIVVDDESGDGIESIVAEAAAGDMRIRLIVRSGERGLAGAVTCGWAATRAPVLAVMDADLQHPPELLPILWRELEAGADLAVGSRYASGGSLRGWKPWRHCLSRLAVWMTLPVQPPGMRAQDPMSGYFMLRRSCIEDLRLQKSGFKILLEILARGQIRSVVEVPFSFGRRNAGNSKASFRVAFEYIALLVRLYRQRRRLRADRDHELAPPALEPQQEWMGG